ncbi:MAG TPA: aromatic ring-hydroxylating dioxygenase subunit alpha [Stellaceae bacterium]|nr:aromatic ring-hydroxylating dioxygenase subunit alpha [Stellaceae bacterium]
MISAEQNDRLTRIGPGTPAGALMRRYWQPAALIEELAGERPVVPVRLLGQDLVLFRRADGAYGLLDRDCPHRGADLAFARLEPEGLRCAFHGWLFDTQGRCRDTPAEPEGSALAASVCLRSYPVQVRNGIVFAYLGGGEPPSFPNFDCFVAPDSHSFAFKGFWEANWLQALEVGIDPAHASYLHRFFADDDPAVRYGQQFRAHSSNSALPMTRILREFARPRIDVEHSDFGFRLVARRALGDGTTHVRVTNLVFPHLVVLPLSPEMIISQWHVPVDDRGCYWYAIFTSFGAPVDKDAMRAQRLALYTLPDYKSRRNHANNYGHDPREQRTETYTGMGHDINVHDQWAVESPGPIRDRTRETLGYSDRGVVAYRRLLTEALATEEAGGRQLMVLDPEAACRLGGPGTLDAILPDERWEALWREIDASRRRAAPWAPPGAAD